MTRVIAISLPEILQYLKIACQIPSIADAIASRKIIAEVAAADGITVELTELQQAADTVRIANDLLTPESTWSWLAKHCLSVDEFEEIAHQNVLSAKLAEHLLSDRVDPFFVAHQLDYTSAVLYEVVFEDEDLAIEVYYALQEGEMQFYEVAQQYSQDVELRRKGGYCGKIPRSELRPEISAAVFAATPPQLLRPIITPKGAHLIQVEEIIQPELDESLRLQILSELFAEWLKQQLEQARLAVQLDPDQTVFTSSREVVQPQLS
ncbi:peptidylprolyl isomerase [Pseudanabaenaceae cyanobacterium LEGE 13415]|nr:peptidylprolyl isomerase [Pseudanabaenaceae cyanobacterium LEGE 13415]